MKHLYDVSCRYHFTDDIERKYSAWRELEAESCAEAIRLFSEAILQNDGVKIDELNAAPIRRQTIRLMK